MLASWYEHLAASAPETNTQPGQSKSASVKTLHSLMFETLSTAKPTSIPSLRPSDDEESKAGASESSKEKEKRRTAVTKRDYLEAAADLMTDVQVSHRGLAQSSSRTLLTTV